eukprot:6053434-Pleurochrysis_carterae.AAC.1
MSGFLEASSKLPRSFLDEFFSCSRSFLEASSKLPRPLPIPLISRTSFSPERGKALISRFEAARAAARQQRATALSMHTCDAWLTLRAMTCTHACVDTCISAAWAELCMHLPYVTLGMVLRVRKGPSRRDCI